MIFIGNGSPRQARRFRESQNVPDLPLFTDPSRKVYGAFGMKHTVAGVINVGVLVRGVMEIGRGHMQGRTQGDPFQNGGIVVLDAKGAETFRFVQEAAGEHLEADEIVGKVLAAAKKRSSR